MELEKKIPGATIRGTYSTYEDMKQRNLVDALGHVVDLRLENLAQIEVGGWGTALKIKISKEAKVSQRTNKDGGVEIYISGI